MNNSPKSSEIKSWTEWFERRAQYYDNPLMKMAYYIEGRPIPMEVIEATIEDVWKKLRATSECNLLDVGAGMGLFTKAFQSKLSSSIGTDISYNMVRDAYRLNPSGIFAVCEAASIPFKSECFDRLICYSTFHYFSNLAYAKDALIEFARIVKNRGLILVGDIPLNMKHRQQVKIKSTSESTAKQPIHYPVFLEHNLKYTTYDPEFFVEFSFANGYDCDVLKQNIKEKETSSYRFDVVIEVLK